jgi:hypothetical protein
MTVAPRLVRAGLAVLVLALVGAGLFGLWHVVVGGLVNGNPRAATFGVELAAVSAALLALVWFLRRRAVGA